MLNKKRLQIKLSKLEQINFKVELEQYPTPPNIAAEILWRAYLNNDILDRICADFGTGNGIFAIGMKLLGAREVYGIDIDPEALEIAKRNAEKMETKIMFLCQDIEEFNKKVDTVIMNPPFGLKIPGADRKFLRKAFKISDTVYCIHKIESDAFFAKFANKYGFNSELIFSFDYAIPFLFPFHEKEKHIFRAGVWRFYKARKTPQK